MNDPTSPPKGKMGWEIAHELDREKTSLERLVPQGRHLRAAAIGVVVFFVGFLVACWLAGNPFAGMERIPSETIVQRGWAGTDMWGIFWLVFALAIFFEFMDATAGMGFGTAITPLLLLLGFDPLQVVPVVMIQQGTAGIVGTFLHREFENVEWRFKPMSETIRLWLIIGGTGVLAVVFSITAIYGYLKVARVWIELYVAVLLVSMGLISVYQSFARRERPYRPLRMIGYAGLAAFNKGIGGGGYGPVLTIGGILSGIPVKSMMAVVAICEGTISSVAIVVWFVMLRSGVTVDFVLLPTMMLATMFAAVLAPYMTRVFPERAWRYIIPLYSLCLAAYCLYRILPPVLAKLGG